MRRSDAGRWLLGIASLAAGVFDAIWWEFEPAHQPVHALGDHILGVTILAYLAAAWLIVRSSPNQHQPTRAMTVLGCVVPGSCEGPTMARYSVERTPTSHADHGSGLLVLSRAHPMPDLA